MVRLAPAALVVALLVASAAAFAYTERLKLTPSPILGTQVSKLFSPTCDCETGTARIAFRLRHRDRVTVAIIDRHGAVVRTLFAGRLEPRGLVVALWDGRSDSGIVLPDGSYRPRVKLALNRRTIVLPNPIRVDTTRPVVDLRSARPRVFSPDGDQRADRVVLTYHVNELARASLYVDGRRAVVKRGSREDGTIEWFGKVQGRKAAPGVHELNLVARDLAGNLSAPTPAVRVALRYIALGRTRVVVRPGRHFRVARFGRREAAQVAPRRPLGDRHSGNDPHPGPEAPRPLHPDCARPWTRCARGRHREDVVVSEFARVAGPTAAFGLAALMVGSHRWVRLAGLGAWAAGLLGLAVSLAPATGTARPGRWRRRRAARGGRDRLAAAAAALATPVRDSGLRAGTLPRQARGRAGESALAPVRDRGGLALALAWQLAREPIRARELGPVAWPLAAFVAWTGLTLVWTHDLRKGAIFLGAFILPFGLF